MTVQTGSKSAALFQQAQQLIPGGVNSPVRAFKSVNLQPPSFSVLPEHACMMSMAMSISTTWALGPLSSATRIRRS